MQISTLTRYPVKSMLGEQVEQTLVGDHRAGARPLAGAPGPLHRLRVHRQAPPAVAAAAAVPRGRRRRARAGHDARAARRSTPTTRASSRPSRPTSDARWRSGRSVRRGPSVERPDPEEVLARGVEAEVEAPTLEILAGERGRHVRRPLPGPPDHDGDAGAPGRRGAALPAEPGGRGRRGAVRRERLAGPGADRGRGRPAADPADARAARSRRSSTVTCRGTPTHCARCSPGTASRCRGSGCCRVRARTPRWSGPGRSTGATS